jgi:hypothetical protein
MESFNEEGYNFVEKSDLDNNGGWVEKYVPKVKIENAFDSTYFFFTKEKMETDISFSKILDEKRKGKLFKLIGVYNEIPAGKQPFVVPRRTMMWELKNVTLPFKEEIDSLLERYKAASSKN